MATNRMRPIHPGEILREEYLVPLNMSAHALAKEPEHDGFRQRHVDASRQDARVERAVDAARLPNLAGARFPRFADFPVQLAEIA